MTVADVLSGATRYHVEQGNVLDRAAALPLGSIHCIVTSPPYWGLRAYDGEQAQDWPTGEFVPMPGAAPVCVEAERCGLGNERTPDAFVWHLLLVFRTLRRVLRDDGTCWVNLGDSYTGGGREPVQRLPGIGRVAGKCQQRDDRSTDGLQDGSLVGIPWRVAFALQADGWLLRSDVVWAKRNTMPESVAGVRWERCRVKVKSLRRGNNRALGGVLSMAGMDQAGGSLGETPAAEWRPCPGCPKCAPHGGLVLRRGAWRPTKAHEFVFMLAKGPGYFADGDGVRQRAIHAGRVVKATGERSANGRSGDGANDRRTAKGFTSHDTLVEATANLRSVWRLATKPSAFDFCARCETFYAGDARRAVVRVGGVKTCPTCRASGNWVDHFALMPPALAERCIKAGSPEKVCSGCGAAWARVVERNGGVSRDRPLTPRHESAAALHVLHAGQDGSGLARPGWRKDPPTQTRTLDFRPTCTCSAPPTSAVVLDPFSGAATTGCVAVALGRRYLGIELSERYAALSRGRLAWAVEHRGEFVREETVVAPTPAPCRISPRPPQLDLFGAVS